MKTLNKYLLKLVLVCCVVSTILGCSKSETADSKNNQDVAVPNLTDAMSKDGQEKAAANALPQGNVDTPLSEYRLVSDSNAVMFTYYALSDVPPDYPKILMSFSNEYRSSNDEFRKQDILKGLQPKVDQEISEAKAGRYLKVKFDGFSIDKYDFTSQGFPQREIQENSNFGWYGSYSANYRLEFTNGDEFKLLKVSNEQLARTIEDKRSRHEGFDVVLYIYAQDVDMNNSHVKAKIMKLSLQDKHGNELLTQ